MSRNKENKPFSSTQRNGLHTRNLPSEDFFTDSLLDESRLSNTSLIPSPSKPKAGPVKPRRALPASKALQTAKDSGNKLSRASRFDYPSAQTSKHLKPSPKLTKKKSPSPEPSNGLTTPPQSRHGTLERSASEFSSPPGGLTESYQRIADEEDLAATERDVDSDEDVVEDDQRENFEQPAVDTKPANDGRIKGALDEVRASGSSTPVPSSHGLDDQTGSFSAPPTMGTFDFVQNEMSDRALAAKLTPHFVDRAKDRERLLMLRQSVPINFAGKGSGSHINGGKQHDLASIADRGPISFDNLRPTGARDFRKARSDTSIDDVPSRKSKRFATAESRRQPETVHEDDDGSDTPDELRKLEKSFALRKAGKRKHETTGGTGYPESDQAPKLTAFSQAYGRSRPFGSPAHVYGNERPPEDPTVASVSSVHSEPVSMGSQGHSDIAATRAYLAKWRKETAQQKAEKTRENSAELRYQAEKRAPPTQIPEPLQNRDDNESDIDWAAAAADVPMPSIERSSTPRNTPPAKVLPSPISKQKSLDRVRRWENNDFTGMSFQVSESPPIRSRNNLNDLLQKKEIEDLTTKSVTSNRLDEFRVKDPNVVVRKTSRSFGPEERRSGQESIEKSAEEQIDDEEQAGHAVPDTPIVVYRSSSQSTEKSKSSDRSMPDSLDQLQRLARSVSTTPRASPSMHQMVRDVEEASAISLPPSEEDGHIQAPLARTNGISLGRKVAETPRVVGSWTDTILPDTIKTQQQTRKNPRYAQTPHVNAGGWVYTPLPNGNRASATSIPAIVEEETEDVTNEDISHVDAEVIRDPVQVTQPADPPQEEKQPKSQPRSSAEQQNILPPSALTNVLNEARQKRLVSRDITDARPSSRDDTETLNLGDATIQSMEDLLTDAADITADLTIMIHSEAAEEVLALKQNGEEAGSTSDVAFIGHLTSRMERLMSNLHEARKGITRLEQKVALTPAADLVAADQGSQAVVHDPNRRCTACGGGKNDLTPHVHVYTSKMSTFLSLPIAHTTFTVPIPLLFHPRTSKTATSQYRTILSRFLPGRPTWLGYLTFAIWSWYILECTMTELYARPVYAERYIFPPPGEREPEFPLVLPTMLYRWGVDATGISVLLGPLLAVVSGLFGGLSRVFVGIYRVLAMAAGWTDGFVDDERVSAIVAGATRSAAEVLKSLLPGDDLSMMNDEIL